MYLAIDGGNGQFYFINNITEQQKELFDEDTEAVAKHITERQITPVSKDELFILIEAQLAATADDYHPSDSDHDYAQSSTSEENKNRNQKKKRLSLDKTELEGTICDLVLERPGIFNRKIPINKRTAGIRTKLWTEVATTINEMYGEVDLVTIQSIWKRLRDNYIRYFVMVSKVKSGAETKTMEKPKFIEKLKGLDSVFELRPTTGNIPEISQSVSTNESLEESHGDLDDGSVLGRFPPKKRKRSNAAETSTSEMAAFIEPLKTATAFLNQSSTALQQMNVEKEDGIQLYCNNLGEKLRQLTKIECLRIQHKFDGILLDLFETKYQND